MDLPCTITDGSTSAISVNILAIVDYVEPPYDSTRITTQLSDCVVLC